MHQILIVEDQKDINDIIYKYLISSEYEATQAFNGVDALDLLEHKHFDLIILDVMMPGINGFEVLKTIRLTNDVPVIMLTAKEQEIDRMTGFEIGCDDYVVKPFSVKVLMKRVEAILRRVNKHQNQIVGDIRIDYGLKQCLKNDKKIELTSLEFKLLSLFFKYKDQVLSREQIIDHLFGVDYEGYNRNIDSYIKKLRKKIEDNPRKPKYLKTKYGLGYVFGGDDDDN
jgi:DNA-binding response OmpR family regulator